MKKIFNFFKRYSNWLLFLSTILYAVWLIYLLIKVRVLIPENKIVDELISRNLQPTAFEISHVASTLDSFIFFLLIGFFTFLISLKKPEEERFNKKLEFLFPSVKSNSRLHSYLREEIGGLACVGTKSSKLLIIQDVSACGDFIKLMIRSESLIRNIHNNDLYANDKMCFSMDVSDVDLNTKILGEVLEVRVMTPLENNFKTEYCLNDVVQLTQQDKLFTNMFQMSLEPHQQAMYKTSGWMWQRIDKNGLRFRAARYTEFETFEVYNTTDRTIKVRSVMPPFSGSLFASLTKKIRSSERLIKKGERTKFTSKERAPREVVELFFYLEK